MQDELGDILHVLVHDLRSPLNVIHGYVEMLKMDKAELSPGHFEFIEIIARNLDRMDTMLSEVTNQAEKPATNVHVTLADMTLNEIHLALQKLFPLTFAGENIAFRTDLAVLTTASTKIYDSLKMLADNEEYIKCQIQPKTPVSFQLCFTAQNLNISDTDIVRLFHKINLTGQGRTKGISLYETSCQIKALGGTIRFERVDEKTHEIDITIGTA